MNRCKYYGTNQHDIRMCCLRGGCCEDCAFYLGTRKIDPFWEAIFDETNRRLREQHGH